MQDAKIAKKWPSGHHHTTLSGYIFAINARIDNRKKLVKQQYLLHMSHGELQPISLAAEIVIHISSIRGLLFLPQR